MGDFSKKEKSILFELSLNSRSPINKMAKRLKMSQQGLDYQIKILKEKEHIKSFHTVIDYACFGYHAFRLFLLLNHQKGDFKQLLQYLEQNPNILHLQETGGHWDLQLSVVAKNASQFHNELQKILMNYKAQIKNYTASTVISTYEMGRRHLADSATHTGALVIGGDREQVKIEPIERKILKELYDNPRISYVNLAAKYKLNPKTAVNKVRALEAKGIIKSYSVSLDPYKYNCIPTKILLRYQGCSPEQEEEILKFCKQQKEVIRVIKTIGHWNVEVDVETKDTMELRNICLQLKKHFGESIHKIETAQMFKLHKEVYLPQSFFTQE